MLDRPDSQPINAAPSPEATDDQTLAPLITPAPQSGELIFLDSHGRPAWVFRQIS